MSKKAVISSDGLTLVDLTNTEKFELYYDEYCRIREEEELKKIKTLKDILKELKIDLPKYNKKK